MQHWFYNLTLEKHPNYLRIREESDEAENGKSFICWRPKVGQKNKTQNQTQDRTDK